MRIACVGGGPAGLYFALLTKLRDPGHDITVFVRNTADSAQGWGVTFGRSLLKELHRSDPESAQELDQAAFRQFDQVVDIHGKQVLHPGGGGYGISRQRLLDIFAGRAKGLGVHIELGHDVMTSSQLPAADFIVACDGMNSRMRLEAGEFQTDVRVGGNKYLLLRLQSDARFSAQWFENISRYVDLEPHEFSALLHGRRSPLLPHLPPYVYYRLHQATEEFTVLGELRRRVGPKLKAVYSQRKPVGPGGCSAIREYAERWD
jgi:2-polyprenyl-6-methoxyphenol hydroxylase-like FAD-dependent oxidoreductase